jgi:hypothetical protein
VWHLRKPSIWLVLTLAFAGCSRTALAAPPADASAPDDGSKRPSEKIGERMSRGAIDQTLETLDTPENHIRMGRILNSPEMRDAVHDLTASMVLGMFEGVRIGSAGPITDAALGESMRAGIEQQLTPALGRMSRRLIGSAVDSALTDARIARLEVLGESSTHAAIRGLAAGIEEDLGPALAAALEDDIGPSLALVIERDLLPAIGRGLDTPQMQAVVANHARSLATQFVGGAGEAIDTQTSTGEESGLQLFGASVARGYAIALFLAFALGTMAIVLTVVLVRYSRRLRQQSKTAAEREAALLNLVDNLEAENPQLKADLRGLITGQLLPAE